MELSSIYSVFFPSSLLDQFRLIDVKELGEVSHKRVCLYFYLEEHNILPIGYNMSEYESKGFYESKQIQDFPIRGKAVYLVIKRRRWRNKLNPEKIISSDCSFIAQGAKLTEELSAFLKGTGREPSRYH
jgi:hypothetical protein